MECVCLRDFRDLKSGKSLKAGDSFEATPQRLAEINGTKYGKLAQAVERPKPTERPRARRAKNDD